LVEEKENLSKTYDTRSPDVEAKATQKDEISTPDKEEVIYLNPRRESHQHEVTVSKENKNQNGKRIIEMKLTGKKARKISKKRSKIEKLQKVLEETLQKEKSQELSIVGISEQRNMPLGQGEVI
jgi:hypothetical protein